MARLHTPTLDHKSHHKETIIVVVVNGSLLNSIWDIIRIFFFCSLPTYFFPSNGRCLMRHITVCYTVLYVHICALTQYVKWNNINSHFSSFIYLIMSQRWFDNSFDEFQLKKSSFPVFVFLSRCQKMHWDFC